MPLFEVTESELRSLKQTSFGAEGIMERKDIQRLLRNRIDVLDERLMVVAEEFGDWLDSSRRIDLLCIDAEANLVVVELKRSEDGGHMELQALRYAAMVSAMTFEQLVDTFARYKREAELDIEAARKAIMGFLSWDEVNEDQFGQDTRIILAAADFSKELTTAVMWLNEREINIRCVRMRPYRMDNGVVILDVQRLIPLPETAEFQTQIGGKRHAERQGRLERHDLRLKFWVGLLNHARSKNLPTNIRPTEGNWVSASNLRHGFSLGYRVRQTDVQAELWINLEDAAKSKTAFRELEAERTSIEGDVGAALDWQELPESNGCRIRYLIEGGYRSPQENWPGVYEAMIGAMAALEKAFRTRVDGLTT